MNTVLKLFAILALALSLGACAGKEPVESSSSDDSFVNSDDSFVDQYDIILEGFNGDQTSAMEEMLESMPGFLGLRPKTNADNGPRYREYWYKTEQESARLQRNLRKALKRINVRGIIESDNKTITVIKTGSR